MRLWLWWLHALAFWLVLSVQETVVSGWAVRLQQQQHQQQQHLPMTWMRRSTSQVVAARRVVPNTAYNNNNNETTSAHNITYTPTAIQNNSVPPLPPAPPPSYRELYPPSVPYVCGTILVDQIHTLYYEIHGRNASSGEQPHNQQESSATCSTTLAGDCNGNHSCSNRRLLSALVLHGGPGAGCIPSYARFFSPQHYRVVLLDQRGAGRSHPRGEVQNNALDHLIADCELLRKQVIQIPQWDVVLGGSWGTALALAYAQEYPTRVGSLILRGVCTLRPCEVDWLYNRQGGAAHRLAEAWGEFCTAVQVNPKKGEGRAALHAYYDRFMDPTGIYWAETAQAWMKWENQVSMSSYSNQPKRLASLPPVLVWQNGAWGFADESGRQVRPATDETILVGHAVAGLRQGLHEYESATQSSHPYASMRVPQPVAVQSSSSGSSNEDNLSATTRRYIPAMAILTCFYSVNERFVMMSNLGDFILHPNRMHRLRGIPCITIQGGQDSICPPDTALDLRQVWPDLELRIPLRSGHSMFDAGIANEILYATDRFALLRHGGRHLQSSSTYP